MFPITPRGATIAALALLPAALVAQSEPADAASPPQQAGATRYILSRPDQGLDRAALRAAILARDPARAESIVAAHVARTAALDDPLMAQLATLDAEVVETFWLIDAVVVTAPAGRTEALAALPGVLAAHVDTPRQPGEYRTALPILNMTNGNNHHTDEVQQAGIRGSGVAVAILDTSFDEMSGTTGRPHQIFFPNGNLTANGGGIGNSRMLVNAQVGVQPADNGLDHGTKVAGVAVGGAWSAPTGDDGQAPESGIACYAISDNVRGSSFLSTMVRGWQQATLDAARFGTKVANLSYNGTSDPTYPEQQAMDSAAHLADLFIATMAGNQNSSNSFYQGAANILAVGSVGLDTKILSQFSPRGGLSLPASDVYPHLVGSGEGLRVPTIDNENADTSANGTSYSSAAVAGLAALYRSVATADTAEETRAAILVTTEDVTGQNTGNESALGYGYARADTLVELAGGAGRTEMARVAPNAPSWQTTYPVAAGQDYGVAISWLQSVIGDADWANLDLFVRQNGAQIAASTNATCTNEVCRFRAPASGFVTIEVFAQSFENGTAGQDFGVAIHDPSGVGSILEYGNGCGRPGIGCRVMNPCPNVEPLQESSQFGNSDSSDFFGTPRHRTQVFYQVVGIPQSGAFQTDALLMRFDDVRAVGPQPGWVEMEIDLGVTDRGIAQFGSNFAANRTDGMTNVFSRKRFQLPASINPAATVGAFDVVVPLDTTFYRVYDGAPSNPSRLQSLLIDIRVYASSSGQPTSYPLDAVSGAPARIATLRATNPNATTGTLTAGSGTVIAFASFAEPLAPRLAGTGTPALGQTYQIVASTLPANAPVRLNVGLSRTTFGGMALPLELDGIGAPGCFVLTSIDGGISATSSPTGDATFVVPVPSAAALIGLQLFHQAATVDQRANLAGLAVSNGVAVTIGR